METFTNYQQYAGHILGNSETRVGYEMIFPLTEFTVAEGNETVKQK